MNHSVYGRKLGRNKDERKRLFRQLYLSLIRYGRIKTTLAKAKSVQPVIDKLITKAKAASSSGLREITKTLSDAEGYKKLLDMAGSRLMARSSGYTRIVKLGARRGDAAEMVYLEFVDSEPEKPQTKILQKDSGKAAKKTEGSGTVQEAEIVKETPKATPKQSKKRKATK